MLIHAFLFSTKDTWRKTHGEGPKFRVSLGLQGVRIEFSWLNLYVMCRKCIYAIHIFF